MAHQQVRACPVHRYIASGWLRPPRLCMIARDILYIHRFLRQTCTDQVGMLQKKKTTNYSIYTGLFELYLLFELYYHSVMRTDFFNIFWLTYVDIQACLHSICCYLSILFHWHQSAYIPGNKKTGLYCQKRRYLLLLILTVVPSAPDIRRLFIEG